MKLILGFLMFPCLLSVTAAGCLWGLFFFFHGSELAQSDTFFGHMSAGCLAWGIALALPLSVFATLGSAVFLVLSLIFKCRLRAFFYLLIGGCGFYLWVQMLQIVYR